MEGPLTIMERAARGTSTIVRELQPRARSLRLVVAPADSLSRRCLPMAVISCRTCSKASAVKAAGPPSAVLRLWSEPEIGGRGGGGGGVIQKLKSDPEIVIL